METTTSPRAHLERGFRLEQAGSYDRALASYRDALAGSLDPLEQAEARLRIARVLRALTRWDEAIKESRKAVELAEKCGASDLAAEALNVELGVLQRRGAFAEATALAEETLARSRSPRVRGITLLNLGTMAGFQREPERADTYFAQAVEAFREADYELGTAIALNNRSVVAKELGNPERAIQLGREAAVLCRRLNALDVLLNAVQNQAHALAMLGQFDDAEELLTESLGHFTSTQNAIGQAECLEVMGEMSERQGKEPFTTRRCYERALEIAQRAGATVLIERLSRRLGSDIAPAV